MLAGPRTVRARALTAQALRALPTAVRKLLATVLAVREQQLHARMSAARSQRVHTQVLVARKLSDPPAAVPAGHARARTATCSDAPPLVRAKTLAERRASAAFARSPNVSSWVAQPSPAMASFDRSPCAMPRAPLATFLANAPAMAPSSSGPASTLALYSLRVTPLGTPRWPQLSFLRAATWALRESKDPTSALRGQIWPPVSSHAVLPASPPLTARPPFGLSNPVGLFAVLASKLLRVLLPRWQPPQRASAVLKVQVSAALPTRRPPARAQRRCEPVRLRQIARASECLLGSRLRRRRLPAWRRLRGLLRLRG
jgi:hypothetical protein